MKLMSISFEERAIGCMIRLGGVFGVESIGTDSGFEGLACPAAFDCSVRRPIRNAKDLVSVAEIAEVAHMLCRVLSQHCARGRVRWRPEHGMTAPWALPLQLFS
jgi:hypothetical protein